MHAETRKKCDDDELKHIIWNKDKATGKDRCCPSKRKKSGEKQTYIHYIDIDAGGIGCQCTDTWRGG